MFLPLFTSAAILLPLVSTPCRAAAPPGDSSFPHSGGGWLNFKIKSGQFIFPPGTPRALSVADLNGNSKPDLIQGYETLFADEPFQINNNTSTSTINYVSVPNAASALGTINDLAVADIDGDSDVDVFAATAAASGVVVYKRNTGNFSSIQSTLTLPIGTVRKIGAVDVDLEGDIDIYAAGQKESSSDTRNFHLLINDGLGNFSLDTANTTTIAGGATIVSAADIDLDGDGDSDFVFTVENSNQLHILENRTIHCLPSGPLSPLAPKYDTSDRKF